MTDRITRNKTHWILLAVTVLGFAVAAVGYTYLISSNCGSSGAYGFFSDARAFHTDAGC